jgi:hypothetical protein
MTLTELKEKVAEAIERAEHIGDNPDNIPVALQIERPGNDAIWADADVELHYDGGFQATGCVIQAWPRT